MAVTWKHFFQGLAQGMPQLGELVYNYTIWSNQQVLEVKKTEAYVTAQESQSEYYGALTEEKKITMRTLDEYNKLQLDTERVTNQLKKKDLDHYDEKYGAELEELRTRTAANLENIMTNKEQVTSEKFRRLMMIKEAELRQMDFQINALSTMYNSVANPKEAQKVGELFSKYTNPKTGATDWVNFTVEFRDTVKTLTPAMQQSIGSVVGYMLALDTEQERSINSIGEGLLVKMLDPEKGKQFSKKLGVDYNKPEEMQNYIAQFKQSIRDQTDISNRANIITKFMTPLLGFNEEENPLGELYTPSFQPFSNAPTGGQTPIPQYSPVGGSLLRRAGTGIREAQKKQSNLYGF